MLTLFGIAITADIIYHCLIIFLSFAMLTALFISLIRHRNEINFSTIILRRDENGVSRLSKIGITFLFLILLLIYQAVSPNSSVDPVVSNLLLITFATELSNKALDVLPDILGRRKEKEKKETDE